VALLADDAVVQRASSSDISGDPVLSLVQLVALLAERGESLPAGSVVLAGAATPAEALRPGLTVVAQIDTLAPAQLRAIKP
jgi:2-oxo-3-hexenedioate decarboxylase